jgi:hypothetical protein
VVEFAQEDIYARTASDQRPQYRFSSGLSLDLSGEYTDLTYNAGYVYGMSPAHSYIIQSGLSVHF